MLISKTPGVFLRPISRLFPCALRTRAYKRLLLSRREQDESLPRRAPDPYLLFPQAGSWFPLPSEAPRLPQKRAGNLARQKHRLGQLPPQLCPQRPPEKLPTLLFAWVAINVPTVGPRNPSETGTSKCCGFSWDCRPPLSALRPSPLKHKCKSSLQGRSLRKKLGTGRGGGGVRGWEGGVPLHRGQL